MEEECWRRVYAPHAQSICNALRSTDRTHTLRAVAAACEAIYVYISLCMCACALCTCECMCICVRVCMWACVRVSMGVYANKRVCVCVCVCVCVRTCRRRNVVSLGHLMADAAEVTAVQARIAAEG
eukprot:GHVU01196878.1.p2 GENE.GHVU01196878.1~~GHVU01196878.1.p2  ORF type:complete len:126 (+),score=2.41 GHVU01196878.1:1185-1562(+)